MKRRGAFASPLARFKEAACFLPHAWLPQAAFSPTSAPSKDRPLLSRFLFPRLPLTQQGVVVKFSHQLLPWYPILERDQAKLSCPLVTKRTARRRCWQRICADFQKVRAVRKTGSGLLPFSLQRAFSSLSFLLHRTSATVEERSIFSDKATCQRLPLPCHAK